MQLSCDLEISFWDDYPIEMKNVNSHKNLYMKPYSSLICNSHKLKIDSLQRKNASTNCGTPGQEILISNEKQWASIYLTTWWVSGELCWLTKKKKKSQLQRSHTVYNLYYVCEVTKLQKWITDQLLSGMGVWKLAVAFQWQHKGSLFWWNCKVFFLCQNPGCNSTLLFCKMSPLGNSVKST